ncbi:MAG: photosystem II reaction center protein PsbN [Gammaproteobacteria bacterium]|nr:photosystem II reaction center protein PsbN [Gammaproteobacteria bacterium]
MLIGVVVIALMGYGIYMTFGAGKEGLRDEIDEHAKMHELGIAHGHEGKRAYVTGVKQDYPKHNHD